MVIVDDHPSSNAGLRIYLEREGFTVWDFSSPQELLSEKDLNIYELFIIDIVLSDINGLELTKMLKMKGLKGKIVIYTAFSKLNYKMEAFECGVDGFLSKSLSMELFLQEILKILSGKTKFKKEFLNENRVPSVPKLSNAQKSIINCIHRGLSRNQIAEELKISVKTYDYHIINLKKVFGVQTTSELREKIYSSYL